MKTNVCANESRFWELLKVLSPNSKKCLGLYRGLSDYQYYGSIFLA